MNVKMHIGKTVMSSWLSLVVVSACQLIMIPVALATLNKVDFALFAVISQLLMAVMLAEMGVRSACARLLIDGRAKGEEAYASMWMASVIVFLLQASVMLILLLVLAPYLADIFHLSPKQRGVARALFLVVGGINVVNYALSVFATALMAGQQLSKVNLVTVIYSLTQLIVFLIAIRSGAQLWAYPWALGSAVICSQSLMIYYAKKYNVVSTWNKNHLKLAEIKTVFVLGFDVFVAAVFSMVMGNSLLIFSGHLLTLEQTAILAVNLKLVNMMTQILQKVPGSASPMLMKMESEGNLQQFRFWWELITKITLFLALVGAGFFVIWNKVVITLWTSEEMIMKGGAILLLAMIPFRYLTHYQFVNSLTVFKEIRKVKWMLVWEIFLYTGLAWFLGTRYGLIGLLSANVLSMLGGALFFGMRWFSYYSHISFANLLQLLLRLIFPLLGSFGVVYLCGVMEMNEKWEGSLIMSMLWGVLFSSIGYGIILDREERKKLHLLLSPFFNMLKFR